MEYKELGRSGIRVPGMAMGCWAFGGGGYWGEQSQSDVDRVVARALDEGLCFFDTAELYNNGDSERALGAALGNRRKEAIVCSKVSPDNAYYETLISHCEASLARLGTDYLDVYMLHWPINDRAIMHFTPDPEKRKNPPTIEEAMAAMTELKRQGKIRAIGISNFGPLQMKEALATGAQIDVNEMAYNIFSRAIEAEIVPVCLENNIAIVGSMALQQGVLAGIYASAEDVPMNQAHSRHYADCRGQGTSRHGGAGAESEMFAALPQLKRVAADCGITLPQLAIAWTLHKPGIVSALAGCRTIKELEENMLATAIKLSADTVREVDRISQPVLDVLGNCADYYESVENSRIY